MTTTRAVTAAAFAATFAFVNACIAAAADIAFEMDVLPSAAGATYVTYDDVMEDDVYSVANGILYQDTSNPVQSARYEVYDIYDTTLPAVISWSAKLVSGGYGTEVALFTGNNWYEISLSTDGVHQGAPGYPLLIAMDTTDRFHDYQMRVPFAGGGFDLYVDGILSYSGAPIPSENPNSVEFGDSSNEGETIIEWDFVRFSNGGDGCDLNGDGVFDRADTLKFIRQCRA